MPSALSYPGVYIEEIPSGVRTIAGVATSITAFVGRAWKGPLNEPVVITSFADYVRGFGGLWRDSTLSYAVQQFFVNGGRSAVVVRVADLADADAASEATIDLGGGNTLKASSVGSWGRNLVVTVDHKVKDPADANLFNLTLVDDAALKLDAARMGGSGARETFLNLSRDSASPRFVTKVLAQQSQLVRVSGVGAAKPAAATVAAAVASGGDGGVLVAANLEGDEAAKTGIYALKKTDLFNLLCIPPLTPGADGNDVPMSTWTKAAALCLERRALLLVDAPKGWTVAMAASSVGSFSAIARKSAALYFPRLRIPDSQQDGNLEDFAPCGVVAGIMSRTDTNRGVWKAPAGIEANLQGVLGLTINGLPGSLTDPENGQLNPLGINCLRNFPGVGHVLWGARTLEGQDILASDWKYVPVRRTALFIEESLYRGTQWVVFEPNDEPLWAQIRLNVGAFLHSLFRQGAFQGQTPRDAYFVKCDRETTTQNDINQGIVNVVVGFAPLKPAEFVVIKLQQMAGQIQA
jgi:phage tail sheath protein FI